jgi:hypothetical protein
MVTGKGFDCREDLSECTVEEDVGAGFVVLNVLIFAVDFDGVALK